MKVPFEELESKLAAARESGDDEEVAEVLVELANAAVSAGRMEDARDALDEAAAVHEAAGRTAEEARCRCYAATVSRFGGDVEGAEERAERAESIAGPGTGAAMSAAVELGEVAFARRQGRVAAQHIERALDHGRRAGLSVLGQATLLRRQAQAWALAEDFGNAVAGMRQARRLFDAAGDRVAAARAWAEEATALFQANRPEESQAALEGAMAQATAAGDDLAIASLEMLRATGLLRADDGAGALAAARSARDHARAAGNAFAFTSATMAISMLCDQSGDRIGAFGALVDGWAALAAMADPEAAEATIRPRIEELAATWGREEFARVRDLFHAERAAPIGGGD